MTMSLPPLATTIDIRRAPPALSDSMMAIGWYPTTVAPPPWRTKAISRLYPLDGPILALTGPNLVHVGMGPLLFIFR
ncbi:hypothetical protein VTO73DRAFT_7050 [Trametes versicolor]